MNKDNPGMFDNIEQSNPGLDYPRKERMADIRHFLAVRADRHAAPQELEELDETIVRLNTMTVDEALSVIATMLNNDLGCSVPLTKRREPKRTDSDQD